MRKIFISGIGTDVGKTVVSAALLQAYGCDYWKPIQAGTPRDTETIRSLVGNAESFFHDEHIVLSKPMSPHAAAKIDGVNISLSQISAPKAKSELLLIEGVGGLLVPLSETQLAIDMAFHFDAEVLLVSRHYLGSINHTLLSCEAIKQRKLPFLGIIFVGSENKETENAILGFSGAKFLARLPEVAEVNSRSIQEISSLVRGIL